MNFFELSDGRARPFIPKKLLLVMKLTLVLLVTALLQVHATGFAQNVTINRQNIALNQLFKEIKKQTGYDFLYNKKTLAGTKPVNISVTDMPLQQVLDTYLSDKHLTYTIDQKTIVVKERESSFFDRLVSIISVIHMHGKVVDEKGQPLPGASIAIKGWGAVLTDLHGEFDASGVPDQAEVSVSFIGYKIKTLKAATDMGTIQMEVNVSALDQVQVIGYGTTSKRYNTGSVATVTAADLQNTQAVSPLQAMEGMVPGMFIQQANGNPGAASKVMLRGNNSLASGTLPLYIIDGVPFDGTPTDRAGPGGGVTYMANQTNLDNDPLNTINSNDIESIDVLKDGDATSIYGSRGANGVIIITTKRAKGGKTSVDGKVFSGVSQITHLLPILNTSDYLALRKQAFANDGITALNATNAPDLTQWSQTANNDYEKFLIGNKARTTDADLSVSEGDGRNGLLISGAYHHESTVFPGDFGYNRGTIHARGYLTSNDNKLKAEFSTLYSADQNLLPSADITPTSTSFPNNYPLYNSDGSLYFSSSTISSNPIALLRRYEKTKTKRYTLNAILSYSILSNLKFKLSLGDDNIEQNSILVGPVSALNPATASTASSFGEYSLNTTTTYLAEPQLDYNTQIGKGRLSATAGGTYQYRDYEQPYFIYASGFASDAFIENQGAGSSLLVRSAYSYLYKYASVFGRLNYNWDGKYILSGTFRRDGSSKFGPGKQFGNFGSIGGAWVFTQESFMKDQQWLSFGKLRGSYGTSGNDQIPPFKYLDAYRSVMTAYGANAGTYPSQIANPDLRWESTNKLDAAVELGFFHDNLFLNVDWFRNRSSNLLASYPLSTQTGFASYTANLNALVQNTGWEFEVKGTPISGKDVKWNVAFNISTAQNKLLSFPGLASTTYASTYVIGQPLNLMALYNLTGFVNGVAQFQDVNHDGRISAGLNGNGDYLVAGTTDPKFYGGFSNNLKYKSFQLDVFFNFVKQLGYSPVTFPGLITNQYADVLNSQFKPSTVSTSASYTSYANYYVLSNAKVEDASYIRLRNVTLSYNLPQRWLKVIKGTNCRIYITGQNLLTFTHYKGFDPETQVITNVGSTAPTAVAPPLKTITGGVQFSF